MKPNFIVRFAGLLACVGVLHASAAGAVIEKVVHSFGANLDGERPDGLIAVNGTLYGTTTVGGANRAGTVFSIDPTTGAEEVLYSFKGGSDGSHPHAGLINVHGTFYGTTFIGGSTGCRGIGCGTVFSINPTTGAENVLYAFSGGTGGSGPSAPLIGVQGTLYGTTAMGGDANHGTVFSFNLQTGGETVLYSFGSEATDGVGPVAGLAYINGTLYGTTYFGGGTRCNCGTVFSLIPGEPDRVLHAFAGGTDGAFPVAPLTDVNGTLYGTTEQGTGTGCSNGYGCGTAFSITQGGIEKVLRGFTGGPAGAEPMGGLIHFNHRLYGTTSQGGTGNCQAAGFQGCGTVFTVNRGVIYSFKGGADGAFPTGNLVNINGTLYGTTKSGGDPGCEGQGCGTVFSVYSRK